MTAEMKNLIIKGTTFEVVDDAARNNINQLSDAMEYEIVQKEYASGGYSTSGVTSNTGRAYAIYSSVNKKSVLYWDSSKYSCNYYYISSETDLTLVYSPNEWNTSGKINLDYMNNGIVFVMFKDANGQDSMANVLDDIRKTTKLYIYKGTGNKYINWVAYGDSITNGSYSTSDGGTANKKEISYAYKIANDIRRNDVKSFYNCGVRGIGWINTGNNGETFDDMLALFTGNKDDINLVTIMLGINDYLSLEVIGTTDSTEKDGTISGNIRYGLRWLAENYQNAKIFAISPINSTSHGNVSNGWSRGARLNNPHTLQEVADMIEYWCDYYGITYINELSNGFINNYNAENYLKDKIHPTKKGHDMLAFELSKKIML